MRVEQVRIGELFELQRRAVDVEGGTAYQEIGVRSFGNGLFIKSPVTGADIGTKRVFAIEPGDLVVSNIFGWEGAVALATSEHAGKIGSHRFMTWTTTSSRVHAPFVMQYLLSEPGLTALRAASPGSAGRNRTLSISNFEAIEVPVPENLMQQRVVAHLDRVGRHAKSLTAGTSRILANKEQLINRVLGRGPQESVQLAEILAQRPGEAVVREATYAIAGIYSFGRGFLDRESILGAETKYTNLTKLEEGNVAYSKLGAFECAVAVVDSESAGRFVSPEFPVFSLSSDIEPTYLRYCLTSTNFAERLRSISTGIGARQKRVHPQAFLSLEVSLPELSRQRELATYLQKLDQVAKLSQRRKQVSAALLPAARNEVFSALR